MLASIGPFRLTKELSAGYLGDSWLAQGKNGAAVMLKRSRQTLPTSEFRFLAELDHPGVPQLADCGIDGGMFWVATHWLDGETLETGFPSGADETAFASAAVQALLYLASCRLIHGDVHPGNLLFSKTGYPARLLDFGLASDGEALPAGRRGFIAPEVLAGGYRTIESDLYGLGASLQARGAARSSGVALLAESLTSPDPQVRIAAAREFSAKLLHPACGPRRNCREAEARVLTAMIEEGMRPSRGLLIRGERGMGKSTLLERAVLEARARGWEIERGAGGNAGELAARWGKGIKPLLVALEGVDESGFAAAVSKAVDALVRAGSTGVLVIATATSDVREWNSECRVLGPLESTDVAAIFKQVSGVDQLSTDEVRRLAEASGGSPRNAVAVARSALTGGAREFRLGSWALRPGSPIPLPVDAAEAARPLVGALDRRAARMLAGASLAAGVLSRAALPVVVEGCLADIEELEAQGLLRASGASVVPVDAAVGNAATERLDAGESKTIHRRLAVLTEEAGAPAWVSAWHWIRACDPGAAASAALSAADQLQDNGDLHGARAILVAARELTAAVSADRVRLDAAVVILDSEERANEAIARKAEALVASAPDERLRRRLGAVAVAQWHRLRRWEEVDAAAARLSPALGPWILDRAAFSREISRAARGNKPDADTMPLDPGRCVLPAEARFMGWRRAARGDFRGAARSELRAANLAKRCKSWRVFGGAVDAAVFGLVNCGHLRRATQILQAGRSMASRAGRASALVSVLSAQVTVAFASGQVGRGLAAMTEHDELATLLGSAPDELQRGRGIRAMFLRFSGKPETALQVLSAGGPALTVFHQGECLPKALSLLDLGRWEDGRRAAADGESTSRSVGDPSGVVLYSAVQALFIRECDGPSAWHTAVAALPESFHADAVTAGMCGWLKFEAAVSLGNRADSARYLAGLLAFSRAQRLLGGEAAARAATSCACAGFADMAEALLGSLSPMPDSPVLEFWAAIARARLEKLSEAALRHLEGVKAFLSEAGVSAKREWFAAAAAAGREVGREAEAASWDRQGQKQKAVEQPSRKPEESVEPKGLASQSRHIRDIVREINAERDVTRLIDKVLDSAIAISGAERGCLVLVDGNRFEVRAARPAESGLGLSDAFSKTISDKVILSAEPFCSGDALVDPRLRNSASIPRLNVHSVVCMPFRLRRQVLGSLYLDHRRKADAFEPGTLDALQTLSDLAAVAIENAQLFEEAGRQKAALANRALRLEKRLEEVEGTGKGDLESGLKHSYPSIVGRSAPMLAMLRALDRATDQTLPVLIQGETGVGKELVARAIHANGRFSRGPFVAENCAAISPLLMESELFGHVKGAFSGATENHEGLFRRANGGVLLLDEIGDLELGLQAKLLRVLENGVVRPVGSDRIFEVQLRVLAATHRDLEALVKKGAFRRDLYYRLSSLRIHVPALRERREDIPVLIRRFLDREGAYQVDAQAMKLLVSCDWAGNVRQLEHVAKVLASGAEDRIGVEQIKEVLGRDVVLPETSEESLSESLSRVRSTRVQAAILANNGSISAAAKQLGMTYQGVRKIAAKHKLLGMKELSKQLNCGSKRPK